MDPFLVEALHKYTTQINESYDTPGCTIPPFQTFLRGSIGKRYEEKMHQEGVDVDREHYQPSKKENSNPTTVDDLCLHADALNAVSELYDSELQLFQKNKN